MQYTLLFDSVVHQRLVTYGDAFDQRSTGIDRLSLVAH